LAEQAGMKQARISAIESPGQVNFSLETLVRLAAAYQVGLQVKFVPHSVMLDWENHFNQDIFEVTHLTEDQAFICGAMSKSEAIKGAEPSLELKQALAPGQKKFEVRGERNEGEIRSISEGIRLSLSGGADIRQRSIHPEPNRSTEAEVPISLESQLAGAA